MNSSVSFEVVTITLVCKFMGGTTSYTVAGSFIKFYAPVLTPSPNWCVRLRMRYSP